MRIDFEDEAAAQLITSDLTDLALAANNFILLGVSGSGISVLQLIASIAAMYVI